MDPISQKSSSGSSAFVIDKQFQRDVYVNNVRHGFHNGVFNFGEKLMLVVSELGEALEADRKNDGASDKIPAFSHVEEELADAIIRILDIAESAGLSVIAACKAKHAFNMTRPYKHGGRKY